MVGGDPIYHYIYIYISKLQKRINAGLQELDQQPSACPSTALRPDARFGYATSPAPAAASRTRQFVR